MVDDPDDNHDIAFNDIEYSVPTMDKAANAFAQFWLWDSNMWVFCEAIKGLVEPKKIRIGNKGTKLFEAVYANFDQILPRLRTDIQFSHDPRGTQP